MNIGQTNQRRRAFTLMEGLVVVVVLALVAVLILPALSKPKGKSNGFSCVNNLKQIDLAMRIWEGDTGDKYPMAVPVALGGAQEMIATGNVVACFQVMSNYLGTPRILICPGDAVRRADPNWNLDPSLGWGRLSRANISYFMGSDAVGSDPQGMVSGDANLVQNGRLVGSGIVNLATNITTWSRDRHRGVGVVLFADGAVKTGTEISSSTAPGAYASTNRVVVP